MSDNPARVTYTEKRQEYEISVSGTMTDTQIDAFLEEAKAIWGHKQYVGKDMYFDIPKPGGDAQ